MKADATDLSARPGSRWIYPRGPEPGGKRLHRSFALVLSGGGARGLAHAGVLRGIECLGYRPAVIVGVSMGAIVGAAYGLNPDWYAELARMDTRRLPHSPRLSGPGIIGRFRAVMAWRGLIRDMLFDWGVGAHAAQLGKVMLKQLTRDRRLEDARIPVIVVASDLNTGRRAVLSKGSAADAVYASAALAGVLPPAESGERLLVDGAYADPAPVDLARDAGVERVIAVRPEQDRDVKRFGNGLQVMIRAMEVCSLEHTRARLEQADLVLTPSFRRPVDLLDFSQTRRCIAAGLWVVRRFRRDLDRLLRVDEA